MFEVHHAGSRIRNLSGHRAPHQYIWVSADKIVLITGASRGIGLETALHFARAGASLMIAARKQEALNAKTRSCASHLPPRCSPSQPTCVMSRRRRKRSPPPWHTLVAWTSLWLMLPLSDPRYSVRVLFLSYFVEYGYLTYARHYHQLLQVRTRPSGGRRSK